MFNTLVLEGSPENCSSLRQSPWPVGISFETSIIINLMFGPVLTL